MRPSPGKLLPVLFSPAPSFAWSRVAHGLVQGKTEERSFLYLTVRDSKSSSGHIRKGYGKALGQFNQSLLLPHYLLPNLSSSISFLLTRSSLLTPQATEIPRVRKLREGTELENRMSLCKLSSATSPFCRCGNTGTEERQ